MGDYSIEVAEGDDVTLQWEADGNPSPHYQWAYNIAVFNDLKFSGSNLNIMGLEASTTFSCTASNSLGEITRHFYVNVTKSSVAAPTTDAGTGYICVFFRLKCKLECVPIMTDIWLLQMFLLLSQSIVK